MSQELQCTPPELVEIANSSIETLIPTKSRKLYDLAYEKFLKWCNEYNVQQYTENVMLAYFTNLSRKFKSSTLWAQYSMIKSQLNIKHNVKIEKYSKLIAFIKRQGENYTPKKSKVLTQDQFDKFLKDAPNNVYLATKECAVTGRKYTFAQIRTKSKNFGDSLRKKFKLEKDNKIAILLPNVPEYQIVTLGALKAGLISTTVNPLYTPEEISKQLIDSSARVIITLNELYPLASAASNLAKQNIPIITINSQQNQNTPSGAANFAELTDTKLDLPEVDISYNDLSFLPYSSGTTGLPKGVQLTHHNIVSNLCQLAYPDIIASREATSDHQDVTNAVLPLFHIYGLTVLNLFQLRIGAKVVTLPRFTPELYINSLKQHRPHVLYVAPPIALFITNASNIKSEDLQSVRCVVNGAAPLGRLDAVKLEEKSNNCIKVLQGYGLTETSPVVLTTRPHQHNLECSFGSIGLPVPNTKLKITNPDDALGTPLGPNQLGELLIKGPQVMKGYYNRPEENIFVDGWMRTGDMMYYNEEGFLFITDRLKELIKVKGFQVAPAEIEEIIRDFPDVLDAAVIGIPHEQEGEAPRAYVVAKPNAKIDINKLKNYVKQQVAPYKQLKGGVALVESIPKNASGKILRRQLKLQFQNEHS